MQLRVLKLSLGAVFLISLASLGAIIVLINPYRAGALILSLFSLTIFLMLFGVLSFLGLQFRNRFITPANLRPILKMVLRQSALVAMLLVGYLWLSHWGWFKIWIALPVLILIVAVEYYFLMRPSGFSEN